MKKDYNRLISGLLAVGLIFSIFQIYTLKNEVENLQNRVNNNYEYLQRDINNIYANVNAQMKKQSSLLNDYAVEYTGGDVSNGTAQIKFVIEPKEYSQTTTATFVCDGVTHSMTLADGKFVAEFTAPLFTDSVIESVTLTEGGTNRVQEINHGISPRNSLVTAVYSQFDWQQSRGSRTENSVKWIISGNVEIHRERYNGQPEIQDMYLLYVIDDQVVKREQLLPTDTIAEDIEDATQEPSYSGAQSPNTISYSFEKNIEFFTPLNSEAFLKTEVIDGDGLHHITILKGWRTDETGEEWRYMDISRGSEAEIYTADGTPLFTYIDESENYWW
ncbi:MAG: hypothetical protein IJ410_07065 [Oscillospiraceae bacterium]|nr:hypothetical protein [Oscillospiraceae bacterium]